MRANVYAKLSNNKMIVHAIAERVSLLPRPFVNYDGFYLFFFSRLTKINTCLLGPHR